MRYPNRGPCALRTTLAISIGLCISGTAIARVGPPAGDIFSAWITARLAETPAHDYLVSDDIVTGDMVTPKGSVYTHLRSVPYGFRGTVWHRALSTLTSEDTPLNRAEATEALAWDLGMTNGYPGASDPAYPAPDLGVTWAGAQLQKAGVPEDIARKALALAGSGAYAAAANYAVAAQLLAEKLACFEASQWAAIGLRSDVLGRFMLAQSLVDIPDYDLIYLTRILQGALSTWHGGEITRFGRRELPTPLRVARVAAAYRDMQGYDEEPCSDDGKPRVGIAAVSADDGNKALCLVAANDRAVLDWYHKVLDGQIEPGHANFTNAPALRMTRLLRPLRPLWIGVLDRKLQRYATHVEVLESIVADKANDSQESAESSDRYRERRALFLCEKELGA
jgi:hypothetical protein